MTNERDKGKARPTAFPITTGRFTPLPSRETLPPVREDKMAVVIAKHSEQINQLLQREFGSLAPPPVPSLRGGSPRDADGRMRQDEIDSRRNEYEAMDAASLQLLVDKANAERLDEARERAAQFQSLREACWPHWAKKDLWSEAEFSALCCGVVPDERGMVSDPGKAGYGDIYAVAINRAADDIRRGTTSKTLAFVPRDDADTAARMYDTARHYNPAVAAKWAAQRFDAFPASLLAAVTERTLMSATTVVSEARPEKSLDERERATLLCIIGALARQAQLDLSQPMKAGTAVAAMAPELKLSERTIGEHLKKVGLAMESRTK